MLSLSKKARERLNLMIFVIPAAAIMILWMGYPLLYSVWSSFYKMSVTSPLPPRFIGFRNYIGVITSPVVHYSLRTTLFYTVIVVSVQFLLGLALALLLHLTRVKRWIMPLFVIPMMIPPVVAGIIFKIMYDQTHGIINYFITSLGFSEVLWLGNPSIALISVIIVEIWQNTPFVLLVLSAGLASLPTVPYEAAKIDGASRYAAFKYITLPLLKPVILIVLLIRTMLSFRVFDTIYILTQGGPGRSTQVLGYWTYMVAFKFWRTGRAAALSYVMVAFISVVCIIYMRIVRK